MDSRTSSNSRKTHGIASFLCALSVLSQAFPANAQDPYSLAGIEQVQAKVFLYLDSDDEGEAQSNQKLQDRAEELLFKAGIPLTRDLALDDPLGVWLYISIETIQIGRESVIHVYSRLIQGVSLLRASSLRVMAITWEASSWETVGEEEDVLETANAKLQEHTNRFIEDFYSHNPEKQKR